MCSFLFYPVYVMSVYPVLMHVLVCLNGDLERVVSCDLTEICFLFFH